MVELSDRRRRESCPGIEDQDGTPSSAFYQTGADEKPINTGTEYCTGNQEHQRHDGTLVQGNTTSESAAD